MIETIQVKSRDNWNMIKIIFSTPSPAFIACRFLDRRHSDWCEVVPHCGFDLHFSNNEWCWASFHVFVSHRMSLEKCLFSSLAHFLIGSFIFLELSCISCLYIFEISCLSVSQVRWGSWWLSITPPTMALLLKYLLTRQHVLGLLSPGLLSSVLITKEPRQPSPSGRVKLLSMVKEIDQWTHSHRYQACMLRSCILIS